MIRALSELAVLFVAPYLAYSLYLAAKRRNPLAVEHWSRGPLAALTMAGLAAAVAGALLFGFAAEKHTGRYIPAHMEDGKLVGGRWVEE
jgi:hypothetical protein